VNLIGYTNYNYNFIVSLLREVTFSKKLCNDPLFLNKINFHPEKKFVEKIIKNL
jgi:hypothetical protein